MIPNTCAVQVPITSSSGSLPELLAYKLPYQGSTLYAVVCNDEKDAEKAYWFQSAPHLMLEALGLQACGSKECMISDNGELNEPEDWPPDCIAALSAMHELGGNASRFVLVRVAASSGVRSSDLVLWGLAATR